MIERVKESNGTDGEFQHIVQTDTTVAEKEQQLGQCREELTRQIQQQNQQQSQQVQQLERKKIKLFSDYKNKEI